MSLLNSHRLSFLSLLSVLIWSLIMKTLDSVETEGKFEFLPLDLFVQLNFEVDILASVRSSNTLKN
jgi:hypothetical protein